MGTRKFKERHVRNITRNNTETVSISLPVDLFAETGWRVGQKVVVKKQGQKLVIEDWKPGKK